jgi:adenylate cyclase
MADVDFAAEGLLDGLEDDEARAARLELLQQLYDDGVPLDELRRAVEEDRLALLPVERVFAAEERYTAEEIAEKAGLDLDFLLRIQQALGLPIHDPHARTMTEAGLEAARRTRRFRDLGLSDEAILEVARVIGQSVSRLAEAMRGVAAEAVRAQAGSERDLGLGLAAFARSVGGELGPMLGDALTAHLLEQIRSDVISQAELAAGRDGLPGSREVGVAFADLVGFTRLGERRPVDELGAVAERLAALASDVAKPPVRLVKTIGDAVMLVSPDVDRLVETVLELVDAADREGEDFPQLRAGVAAGPAINRGGDWYGHTVNLASRLTGVARPGSVLVDQSVRERLDGDYRWSFAGQRKLKGIDEPVTLFRARRDGDGGGRDGAT